MPQTCMMAPVHEHYIKSSIGVVSEYFSLRQRHAASLDWTWLFWLRTALQGSPDALLPINVLQVLQFILSSLWALQWLACRSGTWLYPTHEVWHRKCLSTYRRHFSFSRGLAPATAPIPSSQLPSWCLPWGRGRQSRQSASQWGKITLHHGPLVVRSSEIWSPLY